MIEKINNQNQWVFEEEELQKALDFAKKMRGKHNPSRIMHRTEEEILIDAIRGKLGEIATKELLKLIKPDIKINEDLDFSVLPRGEWDGNFDLEANNKRISIKKT